MMKAIRYQLTGKKLVWNLFFYVGQTLLFLGAWYYRAHDARLKTLNQITICFGIASGSAIVLAIDGLLLFLPTLKNILTFLRPAFTSWLPVDEGFFFHKKMAYSLLFWTIIHVSAHYINYIEIEITQVRSVKAFQEMFFQPAGITGHVMLLIMFIMYTMAHKKIRTQCYEAFWWTHHLSLLFMIALYTHATGCFVRGGLPGEPVKCLGYSAWKWTAWVSALYCLERIIRFIRARRSTQVIQTIHHPEDVLEIRFLKPSIGKNYKPGQYIYLNCAEIGKGYEWHPFSISSAPDDHYISVHIRQAGDFTKALSDRLRNNNHKSISAYDFYNTSNTFSLKANSSNSSIQTENSNNTFDTSSSVDLNESCDNFSVLSYDKELPLVPFSSTSISHNSFYYPRIMIDGPYGSPAQDVSKVNIAVLVGAGIGVTPFSSILKNLYYLHKYGKLGGKLKQVKFIWICRTVESFSWFQKLLKELENTRSLQGFLTISLYLTKIDSNIKKIAKQEIIEQKSLDSFTNLKSPTQFGRPNFLNILEKLRNEVEGGVYDQYWKKGGDEKSIPEIKKVGVFFCGPPALGKKLQEDSKAVSTKTTKFVFVKEKF